MAVDRHLNADVIQAAPIFLGEWLRIRSGVDSHGPFVRRSDPPNGSAVAQERGNNSVLPISIG
jgi:hypothetical protein